MAVIGCFSRAKDGGWQGSIRTLSTTLKARFVPNDDRRGDAAPDFRILSAGCDLGAAWVRRRADGAGCYLSVQLDDPAALHPIKAVLFYSEDKMEAELVWNRYKPD
jgi:uncharacterized protein (DUF736 family)